MTGTVAESRSRSRYVVRLFVAGDAHNSRIARENLNQLRDLLNDTELSIQVIDVEENPQLAIEHSIYVTPALQIVEPKPPTLVYGNLRDKETLLALFEKSGNY